MRIRMKDWGLVLYLMNEMKEKGRIGDYVILNLMNEMKEMEKVGDERRRKARGGGELACKHIVYD